MTIRRWSVVIASVVVAVLFRLASARAGLPNVEVITALSLGLAVYLRDPRFSVVPLVAVGLSDFVLGAGPVLAFTWSAWIVTALTATTLARRIRRPRAGVSVLFALGSSTWFFVWTNVGVWLLGRGTFYDAGAGGLAASLTAGVPFYRNMLLANLVLVPCAVAAFTHLRAYEWDLPRTPALSAPGRTRLTAT